MIVEYENLGKVNKPFAGELQQKFAQVLETGWFILGKEVEFFEEEFAKYLNINHCVGVASGLDALTLSINALNIERGSEIIVPSNTYIATILSIIHAGMVPVLVEPDISTYNINPDLIPGAMTRRTRAVMVVHLYGKVCQMDQISNICSKNGLYLLEDCAQSHGATFRGQMAGTFGNLAGFSFYPTKNLGCLGDGGAVTTNNKDYWEKIRMLRNYGSEKKYRNELIGINSRLDELQAAFLRIKLKSLDSTIEHKRKLAAIYSGNLKSDFILPAVNKDFYDVYHIFNIRHEKRDDLKAYLLEKGIGSEIHYPVPPHKQKALPFLSGKEFPVSEEIHRTTLSLPISSFHSIEDIYRVVETMNKF